MHLPYPIQFEPFWNLDDPEEAEMYANLNSLTGMHPDDTSKLGVPEPIIVNMTADSNPAFRVVDDEEMARVCGNSHECSSVRTGYWCALRCVYTCEWQHACWSTLVERWSTGLGPNHVFSSFAVL